MSINRRRSIAVLLDHLESEYPVTILLGVLRAARLSRARVFIIAGGWLPASANEPVDRNFIYDTLPQGNFDGIIVLAGSLSNYSGIEALRSWLERLKGIPAVALGLPLAPFPSVFVDNGVGTRTAVNHLIDQHARRRLACVAGPAQSAEAHARLQAYRQALVEHGIEVDERLIVHGGLARSDGIAAVSALFDERRFTPETLNGIVAVNDDVALGVMEDLTRRRITIPDAVAVVGFDDAVNAATANPPLTTVNQRVELQGYAAARTLLEHLDGKMLADEKLQPDLVVRTSCGCSGQSKFAARVSSAPKPSTKSCRLALIERRATVLAGFQRAAAGRLTITSGWEVSLFDALGSELEGIEVGKFLRSLERVVRQNALAPSQLTACHDVLSTIRQQSLQCAASDPATQLLLENLFQEARYMVARVSVDVQNEHRNAAHGHLRVVTKACMAVAGSKSLASLATVLEEQLPMLGIAAFSIAYLIEPPNQDKGSRVLAHHSTGLTKKPSMAKALFDVATDPSLENQEVIVVEPLDFAGRPVGIAAFAWGPSDPRVYEQLREMLGMAIHMVGTQT